MGKTKIALQQLAAATHQSNPDAWQKRLDKLAENNNAFTIIHNGKPISLLNLLDHPSILEQPGRITIYAGNSEGKSTLLLALAGYFSPSDVYILPVHTDLQFKGPAGNVNENKKKSFGEIKSQQFDEIDSDVHSFLLALDEWNAFVDDKNHVRLNNTVERWSQKRCVVEALNRRLPEHQQ